MTPARRSRRSSAGSPGDGGQADGQVPVVGRIFPSPLAAKVPEIILVFWVVKILTTAGGEGTLSIHSVTTQRREAFYWATVSATFALGTALGDFTATELGLGYLASGILFGALILIPAYAHRRLGLNEIAAFWLAYVATRPLGACFADYISKPRSASGIGFGDGPTALVLAAAVLVLVAFLAVTRPDIQSSPVVGSGRGRPGVQHHGGEGTY